MIAPLSPGTLVFNRYRIVGLAGQGEFGLTYLAQDQKRFDELCMLKEFVPLQADPAVMESVRQYFHQEAATLYELQHAQLPHYRIMFGHEERLYLVRDYIVGKSCSALLSERRAEGRAFSQAEVVRLLVQTLPVLSYLHQLGIVHENLSPQSIVIRREEQVPVLIDLGLVKRLVIQLQLHPVLPDAPIGRTGFAAPEQEQNRMALPASDVFGLGAIAIALLFGKDPHESAQRWLRTVNWEQLSLQPELMRILKRMVHPNPQKRFLSAQQVLRALEPITGLILQSGTVAARIPIEVGSSAPPQAAIANSASPLAAAFSTNSSATNPSATNPPVALNHSASTENVATSASAPDRVPLLVKNGDSRSRPPRPRRRKQSHSKPDLRASAILVMSVALLVSVVSFRALSWVHKDSDKTPSPANTIASPTAPSSDIATSTPSPAPSMPTRESGGTPPEASNAGSDARAAGVNPQFLSDLTDELFYLKHPDLKGQKLSSEQKDLQNDWTAISTDVTGKLAQLSSQTRSKLGSYERADYERWTAPGSGASLNSRELNVLVNNRFGELFPDQKGKSLNPKTLGQVWYALAEEELNKLKPAN